MDAQLHPSLKIFAPIEKPEKLGCDYWLIESSSIYDPTALKFNDTNKRHLASLQDLWIKISGDI
jgi:hypothetical protein